MRLILCIYSSFDFRNVAEALVSKGLATVVRYRQNDENRSGQYDQLLAAEAKAEKSRKGVHSLKRDGTEGPVPVQKDLVPIVRVQELQGVIKSFYRFYQKLIDFVLSGRSEKQAVLSIFTKSRSYNSGCGIRRLWESVPIIRSKRNVPSDFLAIG